MKKTKKAKLIPVAPEKTTQLINSIGNKVFSAFFIKKDGSPRRMVARTGVTKHIKGTGTYSHTKDLTRSNVTVFDFQKKSYRAIPLDRLVWVKQGDTVYKIQH